jgi:hypothetical protein
VLLSDLADPNSTANRYGTRFAALAAAFNFASDGSVPAGGPQVAATISETVFRYYEASGSGASPATAAAKTDYYRQAMASLVPLWRDIAIKPAMNPYRIIVQDIPFYLIFPLLYPFM